MTSADRPEPLSADVLSDAPGVRHGFFTRRGGVSRGIYDSLNCGPGSKDDAAAVLANRRRVSDWLETASDHLVSPHQVHGTLALTVTGPLPVRPQADALVTKVKGLAIGVMSADCVPVLFADPGAGVVAAAHAGWKGALAGILESTVAAMETLGAKRPQIVAAVGPAISRASYEVGPEFKARFCAADSLNDRFFHEPGGGLKTHFDLPRYVLSRLTALKLAGLEHIDRCTRAEEAVFFSYRRATLKGEPDYGRQISAIVVT